MYLIVGLGNPGKEYEKTRHNVGFDILDLMCDKYNINMNRTKFKGVYGEGKIEQEKVIFLKPTTFMNLSGESVKEVCDFYKIQSENVIIIYDDISLDVGRMRIRKSGSAGGHNGIKNIIFNLSTEVFPRIKVGVGISKGDLISHVLGRFNQDDRVEVEKVFSAVIDAVDCIITKGICEAMNNFNGLKV
ncbi:aminoacyl-tRNA hydrolase [Clostridium pasteurianum]|uniref:Peptidyl-tRNA hydrolase n=1 Tax=Clostridium pasteurianum BC1 TaxID=86416 RepID=R4KC59_CLOPA|nr:aminoacyl-tRNA hydrolase [Clostridium pasteurianum]AGK99281.1 peptidyl-tRNA hydrolase [Clostridium pasteurianum BC1]